LRNFGLIGKSLVHSFSKDYFNKKFKTDNIDALYSNFEIDNISGLKDLFLTHNLFGLNVTIPFKQKVISQLDSLDEISQQIDAVNTIKPFFKNNKLIFLKGYNTDVYGFQQMVKPYLKSHHTKALILGTGGASKAVAYVLNAFNIGVNFISRNNFPSLNNYFTWDQLNSHMVAGHYLIINTTPVGMYPGVDQEIKISYDNLTSKHLVIDLIYNPEQTIFLKKALLKNAQILNGYQMLVHQALKAWNIWESSNIIK
jgi:shikimate dehydrogenase